MKRGNFLAAAAAFVTSAPLAAKAAAAVSPERQFQRVLVEFSGDEALTIVGELPEMLRYSCDITREVLYWNTLNLAFRSSPLMSDTAVPDFPPATDAIPFFYTYRGKYAVAP